MSNTRLRTRLIGLLFCLSAAPLTIPAIATPDTLASNQLCLVDASASGTNSGNTWHDAYMSLQSALGASSCTEIWVAAGVYKPATAGNRTVSFNIPPGVEVFGGFAGTETTREQRDPGANLTVLSGDIDNNDGVDAHGIDPDTSAIEGSNSYHVVVMDATAGYVSVTADTVLDGFTITAGNASNDSIATQYLGGGLYCNGGAEGVECSPTLRALVFRGNHALSGGAICIDGYLNALAPPSGSNPTLSNVSFVGNSATFSGGAMLNATYGGTTNPVLINVTFHNNTADRGGGIYNSADSGTTIPTLTNVTFSENQADKGAAIYNDGIFSGDSSPILTNVTFSGNSASESGGAIFNDGSQSKPELYNIILWDDSAPQGPEIYNANGAMPHVNHSVIAGSGGSGGSWDTLLGYDGGGNLDADPLLGPLADNGGVTATFLPSEGSPAIDAGSNCPATDQRDVSRPQGLACDIGSVEVLPDTIFVNGFDF